MGRYSLSVDRLKIIFNKRFFLKRDFIKTVNWYIV